MLMEKFLTALELEAVNPGAWAAGAGWLVDTSGPRIDSVNPATGKVIATVHGATAAQYERVIESAREIAARWRTVPAPKRGEAVRLIADELRRRKSELGSLVSLEMGKIKPEGDGEVQEMIDIADFAVGQSRMLYGLTMHSERPDHRMYEQWHPLGVVGIISAFNFPVAVWSWNAFLAAICGNVSVWKPSPKTPLCAVAVQKLCNRVLERHGYPGIFQLFIDRHTSSRSASSTTARRPRRFTGSTAVVATSAVARASARAAGTGRQQRDHRRRARRT
jgi:aldehyde dehydrogenase (NAD+)